MNDHDMIETVGTVLVQADDIYVDGFGFNAFHYDERTTEENEKHSVIQALTGARDALDAAIRRLKFELSTAPAPRPVESAIVRAPFLDGLHNYGGVSNCRVITKTGNRMSENRR